MSLELELINSIILILPQPTRLNNSARLQQQLPKHLILHAKEINVQHN